MKKKAFLYLAVCAGFILVILLGGENSGISKISSNSPVSEEFYYFNPDSPQTNLGRLKKEFDAYLFEKNIPFTFQPFTHFVDFHRLCRENRPSFLLVPQWYYRKYGRALGLKPFLVPIRNGKTSYEKILLTAQDAKGTANDYEIISFAMTDMGPENERALIDDLVAEDVISLQQFNVIIVPKDLDAIFALVLGQVKMALVSRDNLRVISDANPRIVNIVKILRKSITVPMPVLCYMENRVDPGDVKMMVETLKRMVAEHPRNKIMEMLQIDDWRKFTE